MNATLTTGLLKSLNDSEINGLSSSGSMLEGTADGLFSSNFTAAIQQILSANGKSIPPDVESLKGLDAQQLADLLEQSDIELPVQLLADANQAEQVIPLNILALNADSSVKQLKLTSNPNAEAVLKTDLISDDSLGNSLLTQQTSKTELFDKVFTPKDIQQTVLKKDPGLAQMLNDVELGLYNKGLVKNELDISSELLTQTGKQELNAIKLADQLAGIDKPNNVINLMNNYSIQSYNNNINSNTLLRRIEVPVQQAAWGEAVGNRLLMMVNDKMQAAHIHLNPPELGPIEVRVNVNQDQASVHFVSSHAAVRDAIEEAFPRLKEMFMQNGLSLTGANVSEQSAQQGRSSYSSEEGSSLATTSDELSETSDTQLDNSKDQSINIGLVDHYV